MLLVFYVFFSGIIALHVISQYKTRKSIHQLPFKNSAIAVTPHNGSPTNYAVDRFFDDKDIKILLEVISFQNGLKPLLKICMMPLLSLAFCPITLVLLETLQDFFWPPDNFCIPPNVNDAISCFLVPAGLVYSIAFGFSLQSVMMKFGQYTDDLSKIVTCLHQTFEILKLLSCLSKEDLMEIFVEFKRALITWINNALFGSDNTYDGESSTYLQLLGSFQL